MTEGEAVQKSANYIANLIESPGRCSCWPACAKKYVELELKALVKRIRKIQVGRR